MKVENNYIDCYIEELNLKIFDKIESQSTDGDKRSLLAIQRKQEIDLVNILT